MDEAIAGIFRQVVSGDLAGIADSTRQALALGIPPGLILDDALIAAMGEVGRRFEEQEFFLPEMLVSARTMKEAVIVLKPYLAEAGVSSIGKAVIGTVKGDLHDIGKSLVGMMLEGAGIEVVDLGTDVAPEKFAEAIRLHEPQLLGLSALLTTTMSSMRATMDALEDLGIRGHVHVMVGGAPVTEVFAGEIGADGYAPDASRAAALARSLLHGQRRS